YLFPLLPLAALAGGVLLARLCERLASSALPGIARATPVVIFLALVAVAWQNRLEVSQYYHYPKAAYQRAVALDATLAPGTLVVMGHYDPSVLYYINRKGWEEDPYLWTPFDEESAIRKGARAYIDIEHNRFAKNVELCAWMQRFPVADPQARWPVYQTDPSLLKPGAEAHWQAFRTAERRGQARAWLDARRLCQRRLD
ncbi:MAG: hypothetical protein JOZ38_07855, partial [Candidatus Eremiobacteraeota bacterium]|nr:hypothetical protein [Candidatus Eremiobacteraeota bacterium]